MKILTDAQALFDEMNRIKQLGTRWTTNCFLSEQRIRELVASRRLLLANGGKWTAFLSIENQFERFYFAAAGWEAVNQAVKQVALSRRELLVTDLIAGNPEAQKLAAVFRENGFLDYALYKRMVRIADSIQPMTRLNAVSITYADAEETKTICDAINDNFDPICDHLPLASEIVEAASKKTILLSKKKSKIVGFCFFETVGITSNLRYFWVMKTWRGQGIGSNLIYKYFQINSRVKRFTLWVNTVNNIALPMYLHYGYHEDQLSDYILMHRRMPNG